MKFTKNRFSDSIKTQFIPEFKKLSPNYIDENRELVEAFFNQHINKNNDFNGSFLVAKNGQVIFEKYQGKANFSKNQFITKNTPIHLASISKVLTAEAIFRLIDAHKITLQDKVVDVLPQFPYPLITIKMLLNHRSGLPKYSNFTDLEEIWDQKKMLHNSDILDLLYKHKFPLDFNPDTKFAYCNTNYAILALVIEKITNTSYKKAMQKLVFTPLKMKDTFVFEIEKDSSSVSQSYKGCHVKIPFDFLDAVY
ncbi:MAG TPA: penicillin-binding protein, partial [Flavobacterium sp.]|nr:penicillin-binding protein [Flavobacterium sp.]